MTLNAPTLPRTQNHERVVDSQRNSQGTPRPGAATRPKKREGRRFQADFAARSTHQRCHTPKSTTRGSSISNRILRMLHAPALLTAEKSDRVVDSKHKSQDAPRASAPKQNSQDPTHQRCGQRPAAHSPRLEAHGPRPTGHGPQRAARGLRLRGADLRPVHASPPKIRGHLLASAPACYQCCSCLEAWGGSLRKLGQASLCAYRHLVCLLSTTA